MKKILRACHDWPCGGYVFDKRARYKVFHSSYYWPSILNDVSRYVRGCDSCQRMGIPTSSDEMSLQPQVMIEPFEKWALDFVGPIKSHIPQEEIHPGFLILYHQMGRS